MLSTERKIEMVSELLTDHANAMKNFHKRVAQYELFCAKFGDIENADSFCLYGGSITIDKSKLASVRKAVGRLSVVSKSPTWNYDKTKLLLVQVKPVDEAFSEMTFSYRTPHKGNRCRVVAHTYTSQSLVCDTR